MHATLLRPSVPEHSSHLQVEKPLGKGSAAGETWLQLQPQALGGSGGVLRDREAGHEGCCQFKQTNGCPAPLLLCLPL